MEILVKVQIDLSADAKSFLASLIGNVAKKQDEAAQAPGQAITANIVPPPAKVKPVAEKPVAEKPVAEKPVAEKPATTDVKLADVRAIAAPLIENHRAAIMDKLREFGAVSVSTLDSKYFVPMVQFLNTLK